MKRIWREFLFWGFVAVFLALAPTILLYTAGYRYQFGSNRFIRTGVLSISANPRNVGISLNGESAKENSPAVLKHLLPGSYTVLLEREGYHDWLGDIDIHEGETTFLSDITLFLDSIPELITQDRISEIAIHPENELIVYATNAGAVTQLWLQEPVSGTITSLHEQQLDPEIRLSWSAQGNYLLIESEQNYLYTKSAQPIEIDANGDWYFDPFQDHVIYQELEDQTNMLNLETRDLSRLADDALLSLFGQRDIELVNNGQNVEIRDVQDDQYELIAILPFGHYEILEQDEPFLLLSRNQNELILLDLASDQPKRLEASGILWDWNARTKELVYSDGHEVTTFETSNGHSEFITRQSNAITALHWLPEGNHLLISTNDSVTVYEQFAQAKQRYFLTVTEHPEIDTVWMSDNGDDIYYLATSPSVSLMRLELRK